MSLQPMKAGVPANEPGVVARACRRTDHAAAERGNRGIAAGMTRGEFERQAGALRESHQDHALGRNAFLPKVLR